MAVVKIDIPGIGQVTADNAASERTLQEILKAINSSSSPFNTKQTTGGGGNSGGGGASDELNKLGNQSKKTYTGLGVLAKIAGTVLGGAFNLLASTTGAVVGSFIGLGKELLIGGDRLTDFANKIPIPGLSALAGLLDSQIDQYRALSNAGAGFSNSIIEISRVAAQAGMPQKEFLGMVAENSQQLKRFGGSVQGGGRLFADMSKQMRMSQTGINLMNLGFTAGELNENMINFSELTNMAGTRQSLTTQQLITGSLQYSDTLDTLSRTTGKHRDLIAQQVKDMMNDATMQRAVQMHGEEFALALAALPDGTDSLAKAVLDMVDGIPHDDVTKGFLQVSKTFQDGADKFGTMSAAEKQAFLAKVSEETTAYVDQLSVEQLESLKRSGGIMADIVNESAQLRKVSQAEMERIAAEKDKKDKITKKLTQFEQTIANIRNKIKLSLIDSGIFESVTDTISAFIPNAEESNTLYDKANVWFKENILPSLKKIYDWFTKEGEGGTTGIKSFLDWFELTALPAAKKAFNYFTNLATPEGREQLKKDIMAGVTTMADSLMDSVISWVTDPETIIKALTTALLLLSPGGMFLTAVKLLFAGIVSLISWEDIKAAWGAWEPTSGMGKGFKDMITKAATWIGDTFSWTAIKGYIGAILPDNKLGDWARKKLGIGTDSEPVALADTVDKKEETAENPDPKKKKEEEKETQTAENTKKKTEETAKSTSDSQTELAMLNTSMKQLIELTKTNTTAVKALNGNLIRS
jgi:hypothetical protein